MKNKKILITIFTIFLLLFSTSVASAKVMWGKTELKQGQIGKVTILTNVNATKINGNTLTQDKRLKKGEEFRVYSYRIVRGSGYYGLGGGLFIKKSERIKYETPSKRKLALLEQEASKSELVVTINNRNNSILVNGISLGLSKQEVINRLGNPKVRDNKNEDYFLYLLKNTYDNTVSEVYVDFYKDKVSYIRFDMNNNVINADWYKKLGHPFAVSWGVTYFYLEGTEQILMFKPNENNAYVGYADNVFYSYFGMEDKMW